MKVTLLLLTVLLIGSAVATRRQFLDFQRKYQKVYSHEEFSKRFQIFEDNMKIASELKKENPKAEFGPTKFSDLTKEEFAKFYLMPNYTRQNPKPNHNQPIPFISGPLSRNVKPNPTNFDWSTVRPRVVSAVKDQGQCGSCWAFSATETIESAFAQANTGGSMAILAPEMIVDCDTNGQDQGCNGGFPTGAYQYVQSAGGMDTEKSYPYTAGQSGQGGSCEASQNQVVKGSNVASYASVNGETGLYQVTSTSGPVSVCVDASSWQNYQSGILSSCGNNIDHCVQLTGYGAYGGASPYWIVRNSWNTNWGQNGYIWIAIGQDLCSIGDEATTVITGN